MLTEGLSADDVFVGNQAGEIDQAFEYLQDSITSRSWIEHDPDLDPIREDPRYQKLLESLE